MRRAVILALATLALPGCDGDVINAPSVPRAGVPAPVAPGPLPSAVPDNNRPPVAVLSATPGAVRGVVSGKAPFLLTVSLCGSSDPEGDQTSFRYRWGDGTDHSSFACQQRHTYPDAGRYEGSFCVYDRPDFHFACRGLTVIVSN